MRTFIGQVMAAPRPYRVAAVVAAVVTFWATVTSGWGTNASSGIVVSETGLAIGLFLEMFAVGLALMLALAPAAALVRLMYGVLAALLPLLFLTALGGGWPFGAIASLCGVAVTAGLHGPRASLGALTVAAGLVGGWLWLGEPVMYAPIGSEIEPWMKSTEDRAANGLLYGLGFALVFAGSMWLRQVTHGAAAAAELRARSRAVDMQAAVVSERARLAHDLHDVVAHHVSLIAVRAETAPFSEPGMTEGSKSVLRDIADDARSALDELRAVLGILRRADSGAEREPLPGLGDIAGLVERARRAGDKVAFTGQDVPDLGGSTGYVAYRVVQEALTNARRHAPGEAVTIAVSVVPGGLRVEVANEAPSSDLGAQRGLAGMRERVEGVGGRFLAGPHGGRFVVDVLLPLRGTS